MSLFPALSKSISNPMSHQNQPIRAAVIGYGGSGKLSHADVMSQLPEFEIRAVCDLSQEQRTKAKKDLRCDVYSNVDELLTKSGDLDIAVVVTRTDTHCQIVQDCLNAGLHTVVTKPWAMNRKEADLMLDAQERSGKTIFPWMPMSWSPEFTQVKELIDTGGIGEVFLIRRHITHFWERSDWQTQTKYGGGYLLNWGMHIVQPILDLVSSPAIRVFGQMLQTINPGDAEDNFLSIIEFQNGTRGIAEFTQGIEGLPSFMVQGTRGMLLSDGESLTLLSKDPSADEPAVRTNFPITGKIFGDESEIYKDIARCIRSGKPMRANTRHSLYGTLVLDAIRKSHQTRQTVDISADTLPLFSIGFH
jgi:predicted dehydrogenase